MTWSPRPSRATCGSKRASTCAEASIPAWSPSTASGDGKPESASRQAPALPVRETSAPACRRGAEPRAAADRSFDRRAEAPDAGPGERRAGGRARGPRRLSGDRRHARAARRDRGLARAPLRHPAAGCAAPGAAGQRLARSAVRFCADRGRCGPQGSRALPQPVLPDLRRRRAACRRHAAVRVKSSGECALAGRSAGLCVLAGEPHRQGHDARRVEGVVRAVGSPRLPHRVRRMLFGALLRRAAAWRIAGRPSARAARLPAAGGVFEPVQALERSRHALGLRRRRRRRAARAARRRRRGRRPHDAVQQGLMTAEKKIIEDAWERRAALSPASAPRPLREAVEHVIAGLDAGRIRVAEKSGGEWITHQWVKKAVLLSFRLEDNRLIEGGATRYYDKVAAKFAAFDESAFSKSGLRVVPPAMARRGAYIARNVVLMPSYVNIGAYVDEGTMVDTWATVGSCAQIGKNVHLSGGVGIGGVLEPLQANPTIIEDNCFIGARSEVVEGVIVEENSVISMGVYIGQSTRIYDRATGQVSYGRIPAGSVVVSGNR